MMKNLFAAVFFAFLFVAGSSGLFAQKFGYVDSENILKRMPEYEAVQKEMDQTSAGWQKELDDKYAVIEKKFQDYRAKEVLMSKEDREKVQAEIMDLEKNAKNFQKEHFGYNGKLFQKREEKMKPVQQKLFTAVEAVAKEKGVNIIFDRAGSVTILYADARYDYSDDVMRRLGIDPAAAADDDKDDKEPPKK